MEDNFTPSVDADEGFIYQKIIDKDLGEMYMYRNKILIVRSSKEVLFFKLRHDKYEEVLKWERYYTLPCSGRIFFMRKNEHIQITTAEKIHFYVIDAETSEPQLSNIMNNYMDCSVMMYGVRGKYGITFKTNERSFDIYRRKYVHDYKVTVSSESFD